MLLKLNLMLLNNGGLRVILDPFDEGQSLLFFQFINHFKFLLRVCSAYFFKSISQRMKICSTGMIGWVYTPSFDCSLGSFLIPLDDLILIQLLLLILMMPGGVGCSVCTCCERARFETGTLSKSHNWTTSIRKLCWKTSWKCSSRRSLLL